MLLIEQANELIKEMEVAEQQLFGALNLAESEDEEVVKMLKQYTDLVNHSKDYMLAQATSMDNINRKLDIIMKKLD